MRLYHGTAAAHEFDRFDWQFEGSGVCSNRKSYGGVFFMTSDIDVAWFFADVAVIECETAVDFIRMPTIGQAVYWAATFGVPCMVQDAVDGPFISDVFIMPYSLADSVNIVRFITCDDDEN